MFNSLHTALGKLGNLGMAWRACQSVTGQTSLPPKEKAGAIAPRASQPLRLAYLISRYPAVSHTFILREVRQLRASGMQIATASINSPDLALERMPAAEQEEARQTFYIKEQGWLGALRAHLAVAYMQLPVWLRGAQLCLHYSLQEPRSMVRNLGYFTESLMLGRWMQAQQLAHLHVHFASAAANVGLYLKQMFGFGLSITVHGPDEFDNVAKECLLDKFSAADFLVCIGYFAQSQVMRILPTSAWHKLHICPLGVDTAQYQAILPRHLQAIFPSHLRILCVGRLCSAKGQHILIQAARLLQLEGRLFHLTFVGSGPDFETLRAMVVALGLQQEVEFTGALNQEQVRSRYASADVFVLPSFAEGIPVVLMEAMASALPCIATRINGVAELINSEACGILLPPSDCQALAKAIADLMDHAELRASIGLAARAQVVQHFDLQHNCARLQQVFAQRLESASCAHTSSTNF